jgi:iron only hydrogenase large subunit-like protein
LGVDHVFDIDYARDLTLLQSGKDFLDRLRQSDRTTVLASSCPGWVCYAEKTHPAVLPMLDRTKSPQQVMGSIVKNYFATKMGLTPDQVYHVSVMPCYDKKLEASRQDFYDDVYNTRDVDLVLSTIEVEKLIKGAPFDFGQYASIPDQPTM